MLADQSNRPAEIRIPQLRHCDQELIDETDYPTFDVEAVNKTFLEWEHHKHENIMTFRDNAYPSLMTGNAQPLHHTAWLDEMDDSMESYLQST